MKILTCAFVSGIVLASRALTGVAAASAPSHSNQQARPLRHRSVGTVPTAATGAATYTMPSGCALQMVDDYLLIDTCQSPTLAGGS